jgi:hypothetical protein
MEKNKRISDILKARRNGGETKKQNLIHHIEHDDEKEVDNDSDTSPTSDSTLTSNSTTTESSISGNSGDHEEHSSDSSGSDEEYGGTEQSISCRDPEDQFPSSDEDSDQDPQPSTQHQTSIHNYGSGTTRQSSKRTSKRTSTKISKTSNGKTSQANMSEDVQNPGYQSQIKIDQVIGRRKCIIYSKSKQDKGIEAPIDFIPARYLSDPGCLGLNLGGIDLINSLKEANIQFDIWKCPQRSISSAFNENVWLTHLIRVDMILQTKDIPLNVPDVYIHICNVPTNTIYLGTRFGKQIGLPTQDDLITDLAEHQYHRNPEDHKRLLTNDRITQLLGTFKLPKLHTPTPTNLINVVRVPTPVTHQDKDVDRLAQTCNSVINSIGTGLRTAIRA